MEELIQELALYCGISNIEVQQAFSNSIVKSNNGGKPAIELTLVEKNLGLPTNFFARALENEKFPVAPTTENPKNTICM